MLAHEDSDNILELWVGRESSISREPFEQELDLHLIANYVIVLEYLQKSSLGQALVALVDFVERQGLSSSLAIVFGILGKYLLEAHVSQPEQLLLLQRALIHEY
jgi:hypothetical protein